MKSLLGLAIALAAAAAALGQGVPPPTYPPWQRNPAGAAALWQTTPHSAVVRVIVPNRDGTSMGSGALVAVGQSHGLVVTNWHVVRDAAGPIVVAFPDGFRSGATLLKTDRDWDLAALGIWRPNAEPIPLATAPPRPGEPLTIAGYGSGAYRTITGRCTQYVSPGWSQPFEMVELSAPARNGDSGGPIFNSRGELAGVLFGSAAGETTGSYCGRVRWFLTSAMSDFQRLQPAGVLLAQQTGVESRTPPAQKQVAPVALASLPAAQNPAIGRTVSQAVPLPSEPTAPGLPSTAPETRVPAAVPGPVPETTPPNGGEVGLWDQVKEVLAVIGAVAILFHTLRLLVTANEPAGPAKRRPDKTGQV